MQHVGKWLVKIFCSAWWVLVSSYYPLANTQLGSRRSNYLFPSEQYNDTLYVVDISTQYRQYINWVLSFDLCIYDYNHPCGLVTSCSHWRMKCLTPGSTPSNDSIKEQRILSDTVQNWVTNWDNTGASYLKINNYTCHSTIKSCEILLASYTIVQINKTMPSVLAYMDCWAV